jgi:predicted transcriptional regulator
MITIRKENKMAKVLNKETGEIKEVPVRKIISCNIDKNDSFYQMYSNGVMAINGIKPDFCAKVYNYLCMKANNNEIFITDIERKEIMEQCKIGRSSVTLALKILDENGIINRTIRGKYKLNPIYSWSGNSADRALLLNKAKVTIKIDIEPNEELLEIIE